MGNLNVEKFIVSMIFFLVGFIILCFGFVLTNVWDLWSNEVFLTLSMGFCISAVINLLKKENYGN